MINKKSNRSSEIIGSKEGYYYPTEIKYTELIGEYCEGNNLSRFAWSWKSDRKYLQTLAQFITSKISEHYTITDCHKMSRISMSCFAATKNPPRDGNTVSRMKSKPKPKSYAVKYEEVSSALSLDKYNQKLMNSIWGLYNR